MVTTGQSTSRADVGEGERSHLSSAPPAPATDAAPAADATLAAAGTPRWLRVALDVPLPGPFDYSLTEPVPVQVGQRVIVPFGRRQLIGVVTALPDAPAVDPSVVRPIVQVLDDLPPLPENWLRLTAFAASYYQRPWGEVMLPALPGPLRKPSAYLGPRAGGGPVQRADARRKRARKAAAPVEQVAPPELNDDQAQALAAISAATGYHPVLLHGITGSGKTEVYLRVIEQVLARGQQALLLVPEINLTPQLQQVLMSRLQALAGVDGVVVLHSGLAEGERLQAWLRALRGEARIVLGTRLAVMTPLPALGLIVVDEEHDPAYKQQEGLRYSARDLAIWRAHAAGVPVVLGSATPSLESWHHAQAGRYQLLRLPRRAAAAGSLPAVRLIDTRRLTLQHGLAPELIDAIGAQLKAGQQALVFLNRRGYAPVLHCASCGWVSNCPRCSAYLVVHRGERHRMHCHHCGFQQLPARHCPDCGNQDLTPMGRGTQRLEEHLAEWFPDARIARIDADSTRLKGSAERLFTQVHDGEIDILVGTQMVAKGHDFRRLGLVGVINADALLFSHDFRAPERLFAQLMQVAGRAGRHLAGSQVMIQTGYPDQPIYQAVMRHDYPGFARYALEERESAGFPPYAFQALLMAEAETVAEAQALLADAKTAAEQDPATAPWVADERITLCDPVPLRVVRVNRVERAQLLVEGPQRPAMQAFLRAWLPQVAALAQGRRVRWQLEVDPLEI